MIEQITMETLTLRLMALFRQIDPTTKTSPLRLCTVMKDGETLFRVKAVCVGTRPAEGRDIEWLFADASTLEQACQKLWKKIWGRATKGRLEVELLEGFAVVGYDEKDETGWSIDLSLAMMPSYGRGGPHWAGRKVEPKIGSRKGRTD